MQINKRLFIVFLLGFSSGLPLSLITGTLQAWFSSVGMSTLATGALSLLGLPYVYRFLWGPLLDRFPLCRLGKRRSWMLVMQVGLLIGFQIMASCNPAHSPVLLASLAFLLACFSATQDAVIDAQRVEYLPQVYHGTGASLAVFGYRLALLVSGGLSLVIAAHVGWSFSYHLMALLMLPGIAATLFSEEPEAEPRSEAAPSIRSYMEPLRDLITRPDIVPLLCFILFYKLGEAFTTNTSGIVMPFLIQGLGFGLDTIGYVNKILGTASIIIGGLTAGVILLRWPLYRALMVFGLAQACTNLLFVALAMSGKNLMLLSLTVISDNFVAGLASTALVTLFMRLVNRQFTATQFSLLVAVSTLPRIFSGPIAALIQMAIGWTGMYQVAFLLSLGFIPFIAKIKNLIDRDNAQSEEASTISPGV